MRAWLLVWSILGVGCTVTSNFGEFHGDAGACAANDLTCDGIDDDCDGRVDEDIDVRTDPNHCGGCGTACGDSSSPQTQMICEAARCVEACRPETAECVADDGVLCETRVDSVDECGECGVSCSFPFATPACELVADAYDCTVGSCDEGHADCDGAPINGCEVGLGTLSDCAACGDACEPRQNSTEACDAMTGCRWICDIGWADCVEDDLGDAETLGCESELGTAEHCQSCAPCGAGERCVAEMGCVFDPCLDIFGAACEDVDETTFDGALPGDANGWSVAVQGDTVVVGAPSQDDAGTTARVGVAYVYRRRLPDPAWREEARLQGAWTELDDLFGSSVAIDGDFIAIGAPGESSAATGVNGDEDDSDARRSGAVYIFERTGEAGWAQVAFIKPALVDAADGFGTSVAMDGGRLVVGAPGEASAFPFVRPDAADNSFQRAGAAYVFARDTGGAWSQQAYLKASIPDAYDGFGSVVDIVGDRIAISAPSESGSSRGVGGDAMDNGANGAGAVYLYRFDTTWSLEAYVKASNTERLDGFGSSLALRDDILVVGAYDEDSAASGVDGDGADDDGAHRSSGAAYVFERTEGSWSQTAYLKATNPGGMDRYGFAVETDGDWVFVGAYWEDTTGMGIDPPTNDDGYRTGTVYAYRRSESGWQTGFVFKGLSEQVDGDWYGSAIAIDGEVLVIGAIGWGEIDMFDPLGSTPYFQGRTYIYSR